MDIKSTKPASVSEAKDILAKRKEQGELGYEQAQALENAERFAPAEGKKVQKTVESIAKGGKISEELAVKIIDVHPDNPATLRAILVKERVDISDEEASSILKELA